MNDNHKTCCHAAYCLLEVAVLAIQNAENYVDSSSWQTKSMQSVIKELEEVKDDMWRRM